MHPRPHSAEGSTLRASFIFSELLGPELLSWKRWFMVMSSLASSWLSGILRFPREHWCCSSRTCKTRQGAQHHREGRTQRGPESGLYETHFGVSLQVAFPQTKSQEETSQVKSGCICVTQTCHFLITRPERADTEKTAPENPSWES